MCALGLSNALGNEARAKRATSATVWQPWEVELTSSLNYTQPKPWWGTELNASFTHKSSGTTLMTPGMAMTVTPVLGNARERAPFTSSIPCSAIVHGSVYIGLNDALTCIKDHHTRPRFRARARTHRDSHSRTAHLITCTLRAHRSATHVNQTPYSTCHRAHRRGHSRASRVLGWGSNLACEVLSTASWCLDVDDDVQRCE
jgi:hypothetical protein